METNLIGREDKLLGYFEEISDTSDHKHLGIILHASLPADRKTGYENRKTKVFGKGDWVIFHKGHKGLKKHTFKRGAVCYSIFQPLWGRA